MLLDCTEDAMVQPKEVSLETITQEKASTLVILDSIQFLDSQAGMPLADEAQETKRQLEDCFGNKIDLVTSGFSDFASVILPEGSGKISGVLISEKDHFRLVVRNLNDIQMNNERCDKGPDPITSDQILISEIADPDNNNKARFIELYNAGEVVLNLKGWTLERYTNGNFELGSVIDLTGIEMAANQAIAIASDSVVFKEIYGFAPIMEGGVNSAADSNGDDNLLLRDPFGMVIDLFGRIGEDGSSTDHEFEDGRALRNQGIYKASSIFNPAQWTLYNDTGQAGTINQPQTAPGDFTPGEH
ncbi:MAG: lamin tail domain-containing protein [Eudoraea sp.]|nr:lamin tail domain-containing protein [Eudoraea sp.]NNJ40295.1 lamin tail domain-containing protein [Eudoraea sp.]